MAFNKTKIVNEENTKIPPEELIKSSQQHIFLSEYSTAEKELVTARINSMGTPNESYIKAEVKSWLATLYILWITYSTKKNDFVNAENALEKLKTVSDDNELILKKHHEIYDAKRH